MADNYLEKKFEDMRARQEAKKVKEQRARERAWKKRMEAYRRKLAEEKVDKVVADVECTSGGGEGSV